MVSSVSRDYPEVLTKADNPIIPLGAIRNILRSKEHPAVDGKRREMGTGRGWLCGAGGHGRLQSHLALEQLECVIVENGWFNQAAPDNMEGRHPCRELCGHVWSKHIWSNRCKRSSLRKHVMIRCHSPRLWPKEMRKYWYAMGVTNPVYFTLLVVLPTYSIVPGRWDTFYFV